MSIRLKIVVLILILIPTLILGLFSFLRYHLANGFDRIERETVIQNAVRVRNSVDSLFQSMAGITTSEANWDDPYEFLLGKNPSFVEKDLTPDSLVNIDTDIMIYTDLDWNPVGWSGADLATGAATTVPPEILEALKSSDFPWKKGNPNAQRQGFLMLPGHPPLALTADVVLHSDASGAPVGYCILARYVNDRVIDTFTKATIFPVNLKRVDDPSLGADYRVALAQLSSGAETYAGVLNDDVASSYVMYRDMHDTPAFIMRLDIHRDIYQQQLATQKVLLGMMAFFGIVMAAALWIMIDLLVTRRLTLLSGRVKSVSDEAYTHNIEAVPGSDEVSYLSVEINKMLKRVDEAYIESEESRFSLEKRTDELEARTVELEKVNQMTVGRELRMIELKKEIETMEKTKKRADGAIPARKISQK